MGATTGVAAADAIASHRIAGAQSARRLSVAATGRRESASQDAGGGSGGGGGSTGMGGGIGSGGVRMSAAAAGNAGGMAAATRRISTLGGSLWGAPPEIRKPMQRVELSSEQKEAIKDVFNLFDTDGSGDVDVTELQILMRALGLDPQPGEAEQLAATFDKDGDPTLNFDEFLQLMSAKMGEQDSRESMLKSFKVFDTEGRGKIGLKELRRVAQDLGDDPTDQELLEMLRECDHDKDGEINFDDWVRVMAKSII
ncbi:Centrin-4 [Geranomyces variabilis]|uniref:Centrin-4 n=1 Tax=Geranomyces variabilis TaxID=109894 RepID=A0AAD5XT01_9FUNG|nr:Centrin-4 [Geranomyces variabilis]